MLVELDDLQQLVDYFRAFVLLISFIPCSPVTGQGRQVSGTVTDAANKAPLPGATVVEKGTNSGAVTNREGTYQLFGFGSKIYIFKYVFKYV